MNKKCSKRGCSNQFDVSKTGKRKDNFRLFLIHLQGYCSNKCITEAVSQHRGYENRVVKYYQDKPVKENLMAWQVPPL